MPVDILGSSIYPGLVSGLPTAWENPETMSEYKLTTVCCAAALALVLTACSSSSDNDTAAAPEPEPTQPEPMEPEPMEPTDLEMAQDAAMAAAAAAMTASGDADMAADGAEAATMNLATLQTGAMASDQAAKARMYADAAMQAYMDAKAASDAAAAATDTGAAIRAQIDAEDAQATAEEAAMKAGEYGDMAVETAMGELMIDGAMKSVGDTSVNAMAGASSVSTGSGADAQTVITGLIASMNPKTDGAAITGVAFVNAVADDLTTVDDETAEATAYKQAAAARPGLTIGKVLDSSDDMARLMLITKYAGEEMVRVFNGGTGAAVTGTKAGYISIDVTATADTTETNNVALRSEGMFYAAGTAAGTLTSDLEIGAETKSVEVFSYTNPNDDTTNYAVLTTTSTDAGTGTTTYTYTPGADITAPAAQDGPDAGGDPEQVQVTSGIPAAVEYEHIHFGAWAGLGEAAKDGSQKIADLGIGFVQSIGDGMTGADMPNAGEATYNGNWAAAVRRANSTGAGDISLTSGDATLAANFGEAEITATLTGLATLEGSIDGSMFSGTKAAATGGGLAVGGAFTGMFSGGFYGAAAAEAGGVFDFTSDGMKGGEFRGAFGGVKQED